MTLNFKWQWKNILVLIAGFFLICFSFWELLPAFTFRFQLSEIKGTLKSARTTMTPEFTRYRVYTIPIGPSLKSQKAELIFYLNETSQKYCLTENIGNNYRQDEFEEILSDLQRADTISVWIKTNQKNNSQPKIFQINGDKNILLDFESTRTKNVFLNLFILFLGTCLIFFSFLKVKNVK